MQDETFALKILNDAFGSVFCRSEALAAARHDVAVHEAEIGHNQSFGVLNSSGKRISNRFILHRASLWRCSSHPVARLFVYSSLGLD
jgi:hypothetical protein